MAPSAAQRKAFRIRHNPRKAKSHRDYSDADVRALYDVSRNTIRNWISAGLRPIEGLPQRLFTGAELNRFHAERAAAARRKPSGSEIFCIPCGAQQAMAGNSVWLSSASGVAGRLAWTCPACGIEASITIGPLTLERLATHGVLIHRVLEATE